MYKGRKRERGGEEGLYKNQEVRRSRGKKKTAAFVVGGRGQKGKNKKMISGKKNTRKKEKAA